MFSSQVLCQIPSTFALVLAPCPPVLAICSRFNSLLSFRFSYNAMIKVQVVSYSMTVSASRLKYVVPYVSSGVRLGLEHRVG